MLRIITTALFSGVLIAVAPAVVLGEARYALSHR